MGSFHPLRHEFRLARKTTQSDEWRPIADDGGCGSERLASSVMRSLTFQLRNSSDVTGLLGAPIKLSEPWWGEPRFAFPTSISRNIADENLVRIWGSLDFWFGKLSFACRSL